MKVLLAPNFGDQTPIRMEYDVPFHLDHPISIKRNSILRMWDYAHKALKLSTKVEGTIIIDAQGNLPFYQWKIIDALFFCNNFTDEDCRYITSKYYLIKTSNLLYLIKEQDIIQ